MDINESIKEILPEKINPQKAVNNLSKNQSGALFIVSMCIAIVLLFIIIFQATISTHDAKKDKATSHLECALQISELRLKLDSVRILNEQLKDSLLEYKLKERYEIIITPKKISK